MHGGGGLALEGFDDRNLLDDLIRILYLTVFNEVGDERVQPVDSDELLGEVEGRTEVVHAAVDVVGIGDVVAGDSTAQPEDAGTGSEYRIPLRSLGRVG